jgi:DNA repair exonuclease SbcCD nuclease subunit
MDSKQNIRFHLIGDPHISDRHINLSKEAIENTIKLVKLRPDVDFVVVMGDVLDKHNKIEQSLQYLAHDWVKRLAEIKPTFVLIGNHDREHDKKFRSRVHPFMGLEDWKIPKKDKDGNVMRDKDGNVIMISRLTIVFEPTVRRLHGAAILFMPFVVPGSFVPTVDKYLNLAHKKGVISEIKSIKDFDLIFAHQEFKGAPYGPLTSQRGDEWPLKNPMVVSGHIHTRVFLQENIYYTGSLYPTNISESYDKGIITASYQIEDRKFHISEIVRVVMEHKRLYRVDATNMDSILEMVNLNRPDVRYVVKGTAEQISVVKARAKDCNVKIVYDVVIQSRTSSCLGYDQILSKKVTSMSMRSLLEKIVHM